MVIAQGTRDYIQYRRPEGRRQRDILTLASNPHIITSLLHTGCGRTHLVMRSHCLNAASIPRIGRPICSRMTQERTPRFACPPGGW